jgi:hypothetical protein
MTIGYTVRIEGLDEAVKTFQNADRIIQQEFTLAMDQSVLSVAGQAKKNAPVGVSGELRASINSTVKPIAGYNVEGIIGSPLPYAVFVEMGTAPHYPPLAPLALWVQRKLGIADAAEIGRVARLIQRKIGAVGTKANPFFANAFEDMKAKINGYFDRALDRIVERLAKE